MLPTVGIRCLVPFQTHLVAFKNVILFLFYKGVLVHLSLCVWRTEDTFVETVLSFCPFEGYQGEIHVAWFA